MSEKNVSVPKLKNWSRPACQSRHQLLNQQTFASIKSPVPRMLLCGHVARVVYRCRRWRCAVARLFWWAAGRTVHGADGRRKWTPWTAGIATLEINSEVHSVHSVLWQRTGERQACVPPRASRITREPEPFQFPSLPGRVFQGLESGNAVFSKAWKRSRFRFPSLGKVCGGLCPR